MPHTIGIIATTSDSPFHTPFIEAVSQEAERLGARLVYVQGSPAWMARTRIAHALADAWLVINLTDGARQLAALGRPVLLVAGSDGELPSVQADNRSGTIDAMRHLIERGHTRIAFLGALVNPDFQERLAAYRDQLAAHGIAYDPDLVVDLPGYNVFECQDAMAALLARGVVPSAVFGANDWAAIGAAQAIQASGRRVPDDIAVVGFDDMPEAAYFSPPLSSVRQRPDEAGRIALRLLLDQLSHGAPPPPITRIATQFIARASSGGDGPRAGDALAGRYAGDAWRALLLDDLVRSALAPLPPDPALTPEQHWPGVGALAEAVDRAARGTCAPPPAAIWSAVQRSGEVAELRSVLEHLRAAGYQRAAASGAPGALVAVADLLLACQDSLARHTATVLAGQIERQKRAAISDTAMLRYFNSSDRSPAQLGWAEVSLVDWATIGVLGRGQPEDAAQAELLVTAVFERGQGVRPVQRRVAARAFPPRDLAPPAMCDSPSFILKVSALRTQSREWGYIATYERYFSAGYDIIDSRNAYLATMLEREELMRELTERQQTLQLAYERERGLTDTIRELGCPLIPLLPGVLLVPLVGAIDELRSQHVIEQVLDGVSREHASHVLLDITGVPLVDTHVAAALIQTTRAVGLLGARVTLVGVRPEIAQSIVGLNLDLGMIETQPTLASAVGKILQRRAGGAYA